MTAETMAATTALSVGSTEPTHHVNVKLLTRAMTALLKHHERESSEKAKHQLLGTDLCIQVQIGLDRIPQNPSPKPIRIDVPHSLFIEEEPTVCVICKEDSKTWIQALLEQFPKELKFVKKVLGLQSLRKKHARFEQQRELLSRYDVFMADDRILPMLTKALGKGFLKTKKQPIPLKIKSTRPTRNVLVDIVKNLSATYMFKSPGTCLTIRAGSTGMPLPHLVENVEAICTNAVNRIDRKWSNIRSVSIKTTESVALPIYNKTPLELLELCKLAKDETNDPPLDQEESHEKKVTKKRKQVVEKSPLLQALKKQKEQEASKEEGKKKKQKTVDSAEKKKKKKVSSKTTLTAGEKDNGKVELSKADFVASKKYKGSKSGFVFRNGAKGVGYYVDVKPVVDKMAMAALARSNNNKGSAVGKKKRRKGKRY